MNDFDVGTVRPVSAPPPEAASSGRSLQLVKPGKLSIAVHVDSVRRASGGLLANTGARLASGFFSASGAALSGGTLAALGASPTAIGVAVSLFAANYVTKLVFSIPLVALGAAIAGERPGEAVRRVFS